MTPQQDPELERALELLKRPSAAPEFREALRERSVAGAAESGPGASSRERASHDGAVDADTPHAAAPHAAAPHAAAPHAAAPHAAAPHAAAVHADTPPRTDRGPRRGRLVLLAAALATAAAVVLTVFLSRTRPAVWTVLDGTSATSVVVDGRAFDAADRPALAAALVSAREVEARGGALRVRVRDEALLELSAGTRLSQMQLAAAGPYHLRTDRGSLSIVTTPAFGQRGLRILTEDLAVSVTGTRFAVDVDERGSCVCCLAGTLACTPATAQAPRPILAGQRCFAPRDRSASDWGPAFEEHLRSAGQLPE